MLSHFRDRYFASGCLICNLMGTVTSWCSMLHIVYLRLLNNQIISFNLNSDYSLLHHAQRKEADNENISLWCTHRLENKSWPNVNDSGQRHRYRHNGTDVSENTVIRLNRTLFHSTALQKGGNSLSGTLHDYCLLRILNVSMLHLNLKFLKKLTF